MQCYLAGRQAELLVYYYSVSPEAVLKGIMIGRKRNGEWGGGREETAAAFMPAHCLLFILSSTKAGHKFIPLLCQMQLAAAHGYSKYIDKAAQQGAESTVWGKCRSPSQ